MVLKEELQAMQERYNKNPWHDMALYAPPWLNKHDRLWRVFKDKSVLLKEGKVALARVVQANEILFRFSPRLDCPAHIVYSTDPLVLEHPAILTNMATKIYSYKNKPLEDVPETWRQVASCVTDEHSRVSFSIYTEYDGQTVELQFIPIIVFRNLLPWGKLCGNYLPVLTAPESKTVLILPKKYWTWKFKSAWSIGLT